MAVNPAEEIVNVWLQDIQGYFTRQNVNVPKQGRLRNGKMVCGGRGREIDILGINNKGQRIWVEVSVSPNPYLPRKEERFNTAFDMVKTKFHNEKAREVNRIFGGKKYKKFFIYSEKLFKKNEEARFIDRLKKIGITAESFHKLFDECIDKINHYSVDPTRIYLYYSKYFPRPQK